MLLSKAMRFISVFVLAVAVVLSTVSVKAAEAGTPDVTVTVNDGVYWVMWNLESNSITYNGSITV